MCRCKRVRYTPLPGTVVKYVLLAEAAKRCEALAAFPFFRLGEVNSLVATFGSSVTVCLRVKKVWRESVGMMIPPLTGVDRGDHHQRTHGSRLHLAARRGQKHGQHRYTIILRWKGPGGT